jgi:hypothetical protein
VFQFCQGLLAGLALLHLIVSLQIATTADLKSSYSGVAEGCRQVFYCLTTIAFTGAVDRITHAEENVDGSKDRWRERAVHDKALEICIALLYVKDSLYIQCSEHLHTEI